MLHSIPIQLPSLSEEDVRYYTNKFEKTGFTGELNYYQNADQNWELTAPWTGDKMPVKFVVGDQDLVYNSLEATEYIHKGGFQRDVPLLQEVVIMEGVSHFITIERPEEIGEHIHNFYKKFSLIFCPPVYGVIGTHIRE